MRAYFKVPEKIGDKKFKGQAQLIMDAMGSAVGSARTVDALARDIVLDLVTRQDPKRVVMFYMSVWLKKGYVDSVDRSIPTNAAVEPKPQEVPSIDINGYIKNWLEDSAPTLPNLTGRKLSEAVVAVLEFKGASLTPDEIVETFKENGYEFSLASVNSAIGNLVRKNAIAKNEGRVSLNA